MIEFLLEHAGKTPVSFHMPGHKGSAIFRKYGFGEVLEKFADMDITEIPGADNLFQAEGIIKDVQNRYADLYNVNHSYLLINGTSGGIIASVLAAVPPGRKLIMARNCHKSVFNALTLGNIEPVYIKPEFNQEYGIAGAISAKEISELLRDNKDAEAVILPSPNYYGICSDISAIADAVHEEGKILIIDQAHGAHLKFFHKYGRGEDMPEAAEDCGADIVINSTHKTLASLTQSAVLNLKSDLVDRYTLEDKLQAVESTSPSYILMSFLDINARILENHGREVINNWSDNIIHFHKEIKKLSNLKVMEDKNDRIPLFDRTKINLDLSESGIDGAQLEKLLIKNNIYPELYTGDLLMLMTGIGNTKEHMDITVGVLQKITSGIHLHGESIHNVKRRIHIPTAGYLNPIPLKREFIDLEKSAEKICAGSIIPYPPGIPLICPGEKITYQTIEYIKSLRDAGEKVIGVNDKGQVLVGV